MSEVDPIARPVVDPEFRYAVTDGFRVAGIAERQPPDARENPGLALTSRKALNHAVNTVVSRISITTGV